MANRRKKFIYYSSPEHWFQASLELNQAVKELYLIRDQSYYLQDFHFEQQKVVEIPGCSRATYLLMSYSLENLLKGIAILYNPSLINKGKIEKEIRTHDLNSLTQLVGINLVKELIDFQTILSAQCVSNARYPVGLNENIQLENPNITVNDYEKYLELFERYKSKLVNEFHIKGWNSGLKDSEFNTQPFEFRYFEKE
jgi:hypothetical protein